jgi:hypothetical protein
VPLIFQIHPEIKWVSGRTALNQKNNHNFIQ